MPILTDEQIAERYMKNQRQGLMDMSHLELVDYIWEIEWDSYKQLTRDEQLQELLIDEHGNEVDEQGNRVGEVKI